MQPGHVGQCGTCNRPFAWPWRPGPSHDHTGTIPRALVVWAVQVGRAACSSRAVAIATPAHLLGLLRTAACACAWLARPVCSRLWITGLKRRFGCATGGTEIERLRKQPPPLGFATSKSQFLGKDEQDLDGTCQAPSV